MHGPGDQELGREGTPSACTPSFAFGFVNGALSTHLIGTEVGPDSSAVLCPASTGQRRPGREAKQKDRILLT